jgi:1-aminocyclopropane-1-carboxylate deaminase
MGKVNQPANRNDLWHAYTSPPVHPVSTLEGQPSLSMLRLDLIRSWASGNKYFKLKYVLHKALEDGVTQIVSKGGMFSNHLAELSHACQVFGLQLINIIRSHQSDEDNPSISKLRAHGDEIMYVTPEQYNTFDEIVSAKYFPGAMFIPEGGLSVSGIEGAREIADECILHSPKHVVIAGGTLGTATGILASMPEYVNVIIVPAWKGCTKEYLQQLLYRFNIHPVCSWGLWPDYHFGGFGKYTIGLVEFMTGFTRSTGIPLDPVYNGKMMFGLKDQMEAGFFSPSDHILAIHTGGLQGLSGYQYRFPVDWSTYVSLTGYAID